MPDINNDFIGFEIEILFQYHRENDVPYLDWCNGKVESIVNQRTHVVWIKWNEDRICDSDPTRMKDKLLKTKWNLKQPRVGAWRQYLKA